MALERLANEWGVPRTKRHLLLGAREGTINRWFTKLRRGQVDDTKPLDRGMLERISHLASIYDALHRLFVGGAADDWMTRENRAFGGRKPLDVIMSGRFEDLIIVRHHVDRSLYR